MVVYSIEPAYSSTFVLTPQFLLHEENSQYQSR